MIRHGAFFFIGLFALMQIISPLTHAHFGPEEIKGFIHVPGLEILSKPSGAFAQDFTDSASSDIIVTPASGFKNAGLALNFDFTAEAGSNLGAPIFFQTSLSILPHPLIIDRHFSQAFPRAPPRLQT